MLNEPIDLSELQKLYIRYAQPLQFQKSS